ncbi:hypothetical protein EJ08DRAFT_726312 [Tothia fuscella]|uniref:HTH CENPB-type domain-containing protein n=1 Tax=Tothia fuscella TaxID=1048955 RepID=A0A9P4NI10_9PEZI|nr:hypothetical protein EJ08DRAFT_726312 [Tothia fuscella]
MIGETVHRITVVRRKRGLVVPRAQYIENQCILTNIQQLLLVDHVNDWVHKGLAPTPAIVCNFAADIGGKVPGKNWVSRFVFKHRDRLASEFLQTIDHSRIKADNPYKYKLYFEKVFSLLAYCVCSNNRQVAKKIHEYKILPQNTYNMDEKGFLIGVLQKTRRIFTKSANLNGPNRGAGQDGSREWITYITTICQDRSYIPPTLIYPAVSSNIQDSWVHKVVLEDFYAYFASSASGWTNNDLGYL